MLSKSANLVIVTGPMCSGKTTACRFVAAKLGCPVLSNDEQVGNHCAGRLKKAELPRQIGWPEFVASLTKDELLDLQDCFRRQHEKWFGGQPDASLFIAEGALYMKQDHRHLLYDASRRIANIQWRYGLVWLWPKTREARLERYQARCGNLAQFSDWSHEKWERESHKHFRRHLDMGWLDVPSAPELESLAAAISVEDGRELLLFLRQIVAGGDSRGFRRFPTCEEWQRSF